MAKYIKKPVVVEAIRWTGKNIREVYEFLYPPEAAKNNKDPNISFNSFKTSVEAAWLVIETREGAVSAHKGDMIIRGIAGEYYPCDPHIFAETYDEYVEE